MWDGSLADSWYVPCRSAARTRNASSSLVAVAARAVRLWRAAAVSGGYRSRGRTAYAAGAVVTEGQPPRIAEAFPRRPSPRHREPPAEEIEQAWRGWEGANSAVFSPPC